ncbi:MAG: 4-amino-4-deoxy-L-arabinose transferase-like protein, partial [Spirosoma sp.]|nr:4-amino-4-deoxy-L-arabinose transferase-like protein [Spirosoma sp.]
LQYGLLSSAYDLHRDEYLHLDQANHPAWGYLSVPPVTAWFALIIRWLGNSAWAVRFVPALFGALTMLIVWKTVEELKGNLFACVLAAMSLLFSVLLRLNQLFQPNSLDVLCWTSLYFVLIKYINAKDNRWLYVFGAVLAVGFLNKYNIVFLLIGLFPALLLTPQRRLLRNRHVYLALGMSLLLVTPNLIWQYQQGLPVIHHMTLLVQTQLAKVNRVDFLKEQILFFTGSILVIVAGLYGLYGYKPFIPFRFFFFTLFLTLAAFLYFRAKGYYAIGIYPIYLAFGSVLLADKVQSKWLRIALTAIPIALFIPVYQVAFPNKRPEEIARHPERYKQLGLLRWEDGKDHALPQDFADMLGWRELAAKVDAAYGRSPNPEKTLVLCDNYGQAGAINYYTRQGIRAVTFHADYINWFDLDKPYSHLIRVKTAATASDELTETGPLFAKGYAIDSVRRSFAREHGTTIFVFEFAKVDINRRIAHEINQQRW